MQRPREAGYQMREFKIQARPKGVVVMVLIVTNGAGVNPEVKLDHR